MLAQARKTIPGPGALRGGLAMDLKWDGYRVLAFTSVRPGGPFLLQSRKGPLIQDRFPDLVAAAAAQLPPGLVLDGELLVLRGDGVMDFGALQRRAAAAAPRTVQTLAKAFPAYVVAFDVLQVEGQPVLSMPFERCRASSRGPIAEPDSAASMEHEESPISDFFARMPACLVGIDLQPAVVGGR